MRDVSNKVLVCNDASILFEEAFWHHTKHDKDIAIVSDNHSLIRDLSVKYAERHYPGKWEMNRSDMILRTPHGRIIFVAHRKMQGSGLLIHRGFILQDYEDKTNIKMLIKRVLIRCRL